MSDTYQAVYDAVRSRLGNCDVGSAVESVMRECGFGNYAEAAGRAIQESASCYNDPSAIYRPKLSIDGNQWCALYGDDLQSGVAGFGDSVYLAMCDFNKNWYAKIVPKPAQDVFGAMGLESPVMPGAAMAAAEGGDKP